MKTEKPLGIKAYGSIPHLPGSRRGPGDIGLSEDQAAICTTKARDKHDLIIVQEKLDGSCMSVAKLDDGTIVALQRKGYLARSSPFPQHHLFAAWVEDNYDRFDKLLNKGERCVGEWLIQAHGTRYDLPHEPFVLFDIIEGHTRMPYWFMIERQIGLGFTTPGILAMGEPCSIEQVMTVIEIGGSCHGALDPVEGAVWRVERNAVVDFLAKYVRPDKVDGCYLESVTGKGPIWNTRNIPTPEN